MTTWAHTHCHSEEVSAATDEESRTVKEFRAGFPAGGASSRKHPVGVRHVRVSKRSVDSPGNFRKINSKCRRVPIRSGRCATGFGVRRQGAPGLAMGPPLFLAIGDKVVEDASKLA